MEPCYDFFVLDHENAEEVADKIRGVLADEFHTCVLIHENRNFPVIKTQQQFKEAIVFSRGVSLRTTYGIFSIDIGDDDLETTLSFEGNRIDVSLYNDLGEPLFWSFQVEKKQVK